MAHPFVFITNVMSNLIFYIYINYKYNNNKYITIYIYISIKSITFTDPA